MSLLVCSRCFSTEFKQNVGHDMNTFIYACNNCNYPLNQIYFSEITSLTNVEIRPQIFQMSMDTPNIDVENRPVGCFFLGDAIPSPNILNLMYEDESCEPLATLNVLSGLFEVDAMNLNKKYTDFPDTTFLSSISPNKQKVALDCWCRICDLIFSLDLTVHFGELILKRIFENGDISSEIITNNMVATACILVAIDCQETMSFVNGSLNEYLTNCSIKDLADLVEIFCPFLQAEKETVLTFLKHTNIEESQDNQSMNLSSSSNQDDIEQENSTELESSLISSQQIITLTSIQQDILRLIESTSQTLSIPEHFLNTITFIANKLNDDYSHTRKTAETYAATAIYIVCYCSDLRLDKKKITQKDIANVLKISDLSLRKMFGLIKNRVPEYLPEYYKPIKMFKNKKNSKPVNGTPNLDTLTNDYRSPTAYYLNSDNSNIKYPTFIYSTPTTSTSPTSPIIVGSMKDKNRPNVIIGGSTNYFPQNPNINS
eukprot:TRINITY_DN1548_c0_g1_i1.p1 TRINITY_DN1548_c0_g1~~TRINITY_DN1548_c0_g1_i1.p1  ORF type:complete len:486 (+),score=124.25 TRINITY_DN1548_c0_g1_i1:112-1569(+)